MLRISESCAGFHLQDLSYYKYDKMINKSLLLLNKFYSAKTKLFKMSIRAMVSSASQTTVGVGHVV
jgi:hypothetical protein